MRHRKKRRKLGRTSAHREALMANLATALIDNGQITTTLAKAKVLRPVVEKLITLGKKQDLSARRQAATVLRDKDAVKKLFSEIGPKFDSRNGGYTRIMHLGERRGDGAPMAVIEFIS
jgi:large subunit ribosomal protein L17